MRTIGKSDWEELSRGERLFIFFVMGAKLLWCLFDQLRPYLAFAYGAMAAFLVWSHLPRRPLSIFVSIGMGAVGVVVFELVELYLSWRRHEV